jgi:N-acylneuraminate cytidylyltransferase
MRPVRVVAVVPARGGSTQIPRKNLLPIGGVPLVARAIGTARATSSIDLVVVSTDDSEIASVSRSHGALIIDRPADISGDTASSESALLHALESLRDNGIAPEVLVFMQATSPFIDPDELGEAVERVLAGHEDVVFSAFPTFGFLWESGVDGAVGVNHDHAVRLRRQDLIPQFQETGAFYVMRVAGFVRAGHRFFGRIGISVTDERSAIDIDTAEQFQMAAALATVLDVPSAIDVDAVVTDFDGVHTDDTAVVSDDGTEHVTVSRSDGMGVRMLREAGIPVLILSTEENPVVAARAAKLRVEVLHGVADKAAALREWAAEKGIPLERIAYLGNDVNDVGCLRIVGWPVVVSGAHALASASARLTVSHRGGHGAVRELAERVLRARNERTDSERNGSERLATVGATKGES